MYEILGDCPRTQIDLKKSGVIDKIKWINYNKFCDFCQIFEFSDKLLVSAEYPELVKKLILVGSGPFEEKYVSDIMKIRLGRLNKEERKEAVSLMEALNDGLSKNKEELMKRFGKLISKSDSFNPMKHGDELVECRYDIHKKVWEEASKLRSSGKLLEYAKKIKCPVVAIHGDYDPHPWEGIKHAYPVDAESSVPPEFVCVFASS